MSSDFGKNFSEKRDLSAGREADTVLADASDCPSAEQSNFALRLNLNLFQFLNFLKLLVIRLEVLKQLKLQNLGDHYRLKHQKTTKDNYLFHQQEYYNILV